MEVLEDYIVNPFTILLHGEYVKSNKLCTRVMEMEESFLVNKPPLEVLKDTLNYPGFTLAGAVYSARKILSPARIPPFVVSPRQGVILFPTKSMRKPDCIYFNHEHIILGRANGSDTLLLLANKTSMTIKGRLTPFNYKRSMAYQLRKTLRARGEMPPKLNEERAEGRAL